MTNVDDAGGDEVEKGVSSDISPSFAAVPHPSPRGQLVAPRVQKTAGKERCQ